MFSGTISYFAHNKADIGQESGSVIYVDIFVAGIGKWYEFRCEETEIVKNIIKEIYHTVMNIEFTTCTKLEEKNLERGKERLKEENLYLACIESKVVLNPNVRLEECVVNNGNRLILF